MSKYVTPSPLPPELSGLIDPDGGFICMTTHWRPNPQDPDPDMPGQKITMSSYIPVGSREVCLCGSGKRYRDCCQRERLWRPICPNPGMAGYSLVAPQSATFRKVNGQVVRERLAADTRLHCVDRSLKSSFWLVWGDPPQEDQYGILCFGDVELEQNRTLVVSAMSDLRMRTLLDLFGEIGSDLLGEPRMDRKLLPPIDKRSTQLRRLSPKRKGRRGR